MTEIEIKAKINNPEKLRNKLESLGCHFSDPLVQYDVIFLPLGVKYSEIKKGTPVVRVRNSNGLITLTLKKRVATEVELVKIEKEIIVNNMQAAIEIVEHMGFYKVIEVNKEREECSLDDLTVCLDVVQGLGSFIEVEKLVAEDDTNANQDELSKFLQSIGVVNQDIVTKGYDTLIYEKQNNQQK